MSDQHPKDWSEAVQWLREGQLEARYGPDASNGTWVKIDEMSITPTSNIKLLRRTPPTPEPLLEFWATAERRGDGFISVGFPYPTKPDAPATAVRHFREVVERELTDDECCDIYWRAYRESQADSNPDKSWVGIASVRIIVKLLKLKGYL